MHRLADISLRNRTVALLGMIVVVAFGLIATASLKQELLPAMEMPQTMVVASLPGADPETIERDVTKPLEDAVKSISGVTKVTSKTQSSVALTTIAWDYNSDTETVSRNVRSAIEKTRSQLPKDTHVEVMPGSTSEIPVAAYAIIGKAEQDTNQLVQELKTSVIPKIMSLPGVRDAQIQGGRPSQVNVVLNQKEMHARGIDSSQLSMLFKTETMALPGGTLNTTTQSLDVLIGSNATKIDQIGDISLHGEDGPVPLRDLATITVDPTPETTISRTNGKPAVALIVSKTADGNTVQISHELRKILDESTSFDHAAAFDQAPYIEQSIHDLAAEGGLGLLFAVAVILFFLWALRPTLISAISIPLSLFIALIGLWATDNTLNLLTLGALTAAVGRVVDDSIVVIENIQRHRAKAAKDVLLAVKEVAGAITSSTLTTVAVFLPLAFVGGQVGEMFRPFAITVAIALLGSLVVSLTVVPVLANWFMKPATDTTGDTETRLQRAYLPTLRWALHHKIITLLLATGVFISTMALTPLVKTDFIGDSGPAMFLVKQSMPPGTSLADTNKANQKVEQVLAGHPEVETYMTAVGQGSSSGMMSTPDSTQAQIQVVLKKGEKVQPFMAKLRPELDATPEIGDVKVLDGSSNNTIQVQVTGPSDEAIKTGSAAILAALKPLDGLTNVASTLTTTKEQLRVNLKGSAASSGFGQMQVSQYVQMATTGAPLGSLALDGKSTDVKVWLRTPVTSLDELRQLALPVSQVQTMQARKAAGEKVQAEQEAAAEKAKAKAARELAKQEQSLRDSKASAEKALGALQAQLAALLKMPPPDPALPPAPGPNPVQQQIAQLQQQIGALKAQIAQADQGVRQMSDSKAEARSQQAQAERLSQLAKDAAKAKATPLELGEIAELQLAPAAAAISRIDGARAVLVSAELTGDNLGAASAAMAKAVAETELPTGVTAKMAGVAEQQNDAFKQLGLAMLAATAIVYLIMVATFGSLLQPFLLLVSIPFAATGAIGLSIVTDTPIGMPSMIGLLMLIGIVVTNAIVLIDLINQYRARGDSLEDATIHGARLRLRPIVMTALATVFALLPMAFGFTGGGLFISKPLAIVVIGGLISSTVLTLILVPVLYPLVEKIRGRAARSSTSAPTNPPASAPMPTPPPVLPAK